MIISNTNLGSYYVIATISKIFKIVNENIDTNTITLLENVSQAVGLIENNRSTVSISAQADPLVTITKS